MQKGNALILLLVGILVLAGVAGGAFYLGRSTTPKPSPSPAAASQTPQPTSIPQPSSTTDETANWKTYKYNTFFVRLSDRWTLKKTETAFDSLIESFTFEAKNDPYELTFQVTNNPYPLEEHIGEKENIVLDGQPAIKFITIAGQGADRYEPGIQSNYGGKRFNIWVSAKSNLVQANKELDQILSTFRFTQ